MLKNLYIRLTIFATLVIIFSSCSNSDKITSGELQKHIRYLASDSLKGRMTGTQGDSLAAIYIRDELASYGFKPITGDGLQLFSITKGIVVGQSNSISAEGEDFISSDFAPMSFSSNGSAEGELIFAGYGFNIDTDSLKWNDYNKIDIAGKWVMILRADPDADKTSSPFIPFSNDRDKAMIAKDMGAAGVLMVSGALFDPEDKFEELSSSDFSSGIPVLHIKREAADRLLKKSRKSITDLEAGLNKSGKPSSFATGVIVKGSAELIRETADSRNVAMILSSENEQLADEYLVIGGHFDHLGMGGPGSSSRAVDTIAVHYGADDNASGISAMLEIAEKFSASDPATRRSIICLGFSGEELGLLGSKAYVEQPGIDLSKVNAMLNLDMVGRLQRGGGLQAGGVGTSPNLKDIILGKNDSSVINLSFTEEGYGPSDHSSFYGKNIPVIFFTTGAHLDYHTPSDVFDSINFEGMVHVTNLVYNVAEELATMKEKLEFREAGPKVDQSRTMRRQGVTLGFMPDFAGNVKNGLRADFITPGKPAALGGMKKGDIITAIEGKPVNNIQDYMFRMGQLKHGQTISVEITRNDEKIVLLIQL